MTPDAAVTVAVAVAVPAEPAAEAAQQEDDQDDNQYQAKRHGIFPRGRPADGNPPPVTQRKAYPDHWFQRRNREFVRLALFRLQF